MEWVERNNTLQKTYSFSTFSEAMQWMARAADVIDRMDHHPEWTNVYNKVYVSLCTHSAGNQVTDKDRELAKALDAV